MKLRVKVWNLRFRLAYTLLPGVHKHVMCLDENEAAGCENYICSQPKG